MTTTNQNLAVRQYQQEYKGILNAVFTVNKAFSKAFAPLQILDGVQQNKKAFMVKTNTTPVVIGTYNTDVNTGFGTGTENSSRFGELKEVIYTDTEVDYSYTLAIHEGIDRYTVNQDMQQAIADRFKLQSEAQVRRANKENGKFLSDNAGKTEKLTALTEEAVDKLFDDVTAYYINNEMNAPVTLYLRPELYNKIIKLKNVNTAKGSSVNIDTNGLAKYQDITLEKTPAQYFAEDTIAIFSPDGIAIPFIGIQTARTIDAVEFDGIKIQAAAKGGSFVLEDNKKAIIKVTGTIA